MHIVQPCVAAQCAASYNTSAPAGIGLCAEDVNLGRLPGWEPRSYGYHGNGGHAFHPAHAKVACLHAPHYPLYFWGAACASWPATVLPPCLPHPHTSRNCAGIGFCAEDVNLGRLPGWEPRSYGYHGDDGHAFHGSGTGRPFGPGFTTGDVVGALLDRGLNTISFFK